MLLKEDKTIREIRDYCQVNGIKDVNSFILQMIRRGFSIEKYGEKPGILHGVDDSEPNNTIAKDETTVAQTCSSIFNTKGKERQSETPVEKSKGTTRTLK